MSPAQMLLGRDLRNFLPGTKPKARTPLGPTTIKLTIRYTTISTSSPPPPSLAVPSLIGLYRILVSKPPPPYPSSPFLTHPHLTSSCLAQSHRTSPNLFCLNITYHHPTSLYLTQPGQFLPNTTTLPTSPNHTQPQPTPPSLTKPNPTFPTSLDFS